MFAEELRKKSSRCKAMLFQSSANGAQVGSFFFMSLCLFLYIENNFCIYFSFKN